MSIATTNPATGATEATFTTDTDSDIERKLAESHEAYRALRTTDFATRAAWMHAAADRLDAEIDDVARMLTTEMGKPIVQARAEVAKSATTMRFYADHAAEFLAGRTLDDPSRVGATAARVQYEPLGVVLAVMPWNYPLWQVIRFAAPALMAGNAGVLKHASNVPQAALYLDTLFERAGFPTGAFHALLIPASRVEGVLRDRRIVAATLTGSEPAGRSVAAIAGSEVKHVVLELGGSDPFIVMPSADLDAASSTAVAARVSNNGQACINAKRFIVHADVYEEFARLFAQKMAALKVGDPLEESTEVGPVATESGLAELEAFVSDAVGKGATVLTGGAPVDGDGWYFPPTVITGITRDMRLYAEEAFGPLASLYRAESASDALRIANDTTFGLSSAVWTNDEDEEDAFVSGLETGAVFINGMSISYPDLPFGGVKDSGVGRELSAEGIREFTNVKSVWKA